MPANRRSGIQIAWKTITYRSLIMLILMGLAIVAAGTRLAFPEFTQNTVKAATNVFTNLLERVAAPENMGRKGGFSSLLPERFHSPRVAIDGDRLKLGFRYG